MRSEAASTRPRSNSAAFCMIEARWKRVSFGLYARAAAKALRTSSTVAFGTVPTTSLLYGYLTSITRCLVARSFMVCSAAMGSDPGLRLCSVQGLAPVLSGSRRCLVQGPAPVFQFFEVIEGDVENIEVSQAPLWHADRLAVEEQRNHLLGDAAVGAQRRVEAREIVAREARAQDHVPRRDDDEVAQPVRR